MIVLMKDPLSRHPGTLFHARVAARPMTPPKNRQGLARPFFPVVYFSRGPPKKGKRALLGDLVGEQESETIPN